MTFSFSKIKWTLGFHWLCLQVGLLMDCMYFPIRVSWKKSVYNGAFRRLRGFHLSTQRQHFLWLLLKGAIHITFGQIPRTNPWFHFSSRYYQFHFLACYGEGKLIAGQSNNIQLENIWLWRHGHSLKDPLNEGENVEEF